MILAILSLAILAGVAYYHYVQGAFSSTISALCALVAALVAMGYYESIVMLFPPGKMADMAAGMVLIATYGVVYIILRLILDGLVPGNIRLSMWVDRGFAGAFGLVAGAMSAGIFAVAAQLLPFGPAGGMPALYALQDRNVIVPGSSVQNARSDVDASIRNETKEDTFDPEVAPSSGLWVPVDAILVGLTRAASDGAFAGANSFSANHPALLLEAFGNRLGAEQGGKKVIINSPKQTGVSVGATDGLFILPASPTSADNEIPRIREGGKGLAAPKDGGKKYLVVRAFFDRSAADLDDYVRIAAAGAPLVIEGKIYYPIGTMTESGQVALARIDDQIIVPLKGDTNGADFVYLVEAPLLDRLTKTGKVTGAAFVQFKLLGRIPLNGHATDATWAPSPKTRVLKKAASPLASPPAAPAPAPAAG